MQRQAAVVQARDALGERKPETGAAPGRAGILCTRAPAGITLRSQIPRSLHLPDLLVVFDPALPKLAAFLAVAARGSFLRAMSGFALGLILTGTVLGLAPVALLPPIGPAPVVQSV